MLNGKIMVAKENFKLNSYPGIDHLANKLRSRHLHAFDPEVRLGFGFMHKPNTRVDEENFICHYYALVYVIRGTGEYRLPDGRVYDLLPGSVFQRHPGIEHSTYLDADSQWAECFLDFGKDLYDALIGCQIIKRSDYVYFLGQDSTLESEFYNLLNRLEHESDKELPYLIADTVSFLSKIMKRCRSMAENELDRIIEQGTVDLGQNLNKRIDLRQYCREKGIGYENFRKLFSKKIGIPPGQYIIRRRMDAACQMLLLLEKTIGEIALSLGYKSQYEFSAQFKKFIGISPKMYRNRRGKVW